MKRSVVRALFACCLSLMLMGSTCDWFSDLFSRSSSDPGVAGISAQNVCVEIQDDVIDCVVSARGPLNGVLVYDWEPTALLDGRFARTSNRERFDFRQICSTQDVRGVAVGLDINVSFRDRGGDGDLHGPFGSVQALTVCDFR